MTGILYFADEAGNSGSNYLDRAQPYYVLAGLVVRPHQVEPARAVVRRALTGTQAPELSARTMFRRADRNIPVVRRILGDLGQVGAVPAASLIEKRFALGARVADAFLDFAYNPEVTPAFRGVDLARSAAHVFAELSPATLAAANLMMKDPSDGVARTCCKLVADELESSGKAWLAARVRGALLADDLSQASNAVVRAGLSPNVSAFMNVLAKLQPLGAAMAARVSIVHDEQVHFEEALRYFLAFAADPASQEHLEALGNEAVMPTLSNIREPTFVTSHDEPLVQAADLLAGSINYLLRRLDEAQPWTKDEWELALLALGGFVIEGAEIFHHSLGSDSLGERLVGAIYGGQVAHGVRPVEPE